jgi:hypothetical protein
MDAASFNSTFKCPTCGGALLMSGRRLSLVLLAIIACLAWLGCRPATQPTGGGQRIRPFVQKDSGPRRVPSMKLDDDFLRVRLLMLKTVQRDLGLTADQTDKLDKLKNASTTEFRNFTAKARDILPPHRHFTTEEFEAREQKFRALSDEFKRKSKELQSQALGILTRAQNERLKEVQLQTSIPAALARPEIVETLHISKEQTATIRSLCNQTEEQLLAKWPNLRGLSPEQRRQRIIEYMKESDRAYASDAKRILDVLTPQQRTQFEKLQGRKIEITWPYDEMIPENWEGVGGAQQE